MVTYWLEGKKTSLISKDDSPDTPDTKANKQVTMETEKEKELYSSMPGYLNEDLLLDPA